MNGINYGLTTDEKALLLALLGKIQLNHCKNYDDSRFGWSCASKFDNQVCPFEYEDYLEGEHSECDFYCPIFLIRNVLKERLK